MLTANRQAVFDMMNKCVKAGRQHQYTNPDRAVEELEKLKILHDVLKSVTNFEAKLVSDLDID
jgi:hypothetical protein